MEEFFTYATPLTLASFIADLDQAEEENKDLRMLVFATLESIVGEEEANQLIAKFS